ncbi:MAG: PAS domain S-box protein [Verrucomicrobiota bacterium]
MFLKPMTWLAVMVASTLASASASAATNGVINASTNPGTPADSTRTGITSNRPPFRPDQLPATTISALLKSHGAESNRMVRLQGIVLDQRLGEYVVLQDETGSLRVETRQTTPLGGGESVLAWGRPALDGSHLVLKNASVWPTAWNAETQETFAPAPGKPAELPLLTLVREIRDLPPAQAAWKYPVKIRGVITAVRNDYKAFWIQDRTAGVFVDTSSASVSTNLAPGDEMEVAGFSGPGGYAPVINAESARFIGHGVMPPPRQVSLYQMATGQYDSQWVEVRGVVRSAQRNRRLVELQLSDINGLVEINLPEGDNLTNLVDSLVRVRGVCGSRPNPARQLNSTYIWSPSEEFVLVEEKGAADPFQLAPQSVSSLSQFSRGRAFQHRVKITGIVTLADPEHLFVQDDTGGIPVYLKKELHLLPGDRVDVAGYTSLGDFGVALRDAECRITGKSPLPAPHPAVSATPLDPTLHGSRVRMTARLVGLSHQGRQDVLTLQANDTVFEALRPIPAQDKAENLTEGSLLQLDGVYSILGDEMRMPRGLRLYLAPNDSVHVLQKPAWWSRHAATALAVMAAIIAAAALWAATLRHRIASQTLIIRERLEKEAALEQRYREIFEGANDLIFTLDDAGRLTSLNPAGQRALGYTAAEVPGLSFEQILSPASRPEGLRVFQSKLTGPHEGGTPSTWECQFITRDGAELMVETSAWVMNRNGKPVGVQAISRDITGRKHAEEALQRSEQKFRSLVEESLVGVYLIRNHRFIYANPRMVEILGFSPQELSALPSLLDTVFEEDRLLVQEQLRKRMAGEVQNVHYQYRARRKDGEIVFLEALGSRTELGNEPVILGTLMDITERKRAEAALAEASSLMETLLQNSLDRIYFKDRDSRFVCCSRAFEDFFHISDFHQLKGRTDFDFFAEEHARPAFLEEQEIVRTGKPMIAKLERECHADGRVTWALTTKMPWRDKDGNIIGTFGISKDLTAMKQAEQELAYERELFRALVDKLPDNLYFKDRQSRFVRVSKSKISTTLPIARNLYRKRNPGASDADLPPHLHDAEAFGAYLIGRTDFDTFEETFARRAFDEEKHIMETGVPVIGKLEQVPNSDGSSRWMFVTKMPWHDKDGNLIGTFGVSRDVTALKEAEAKLEQVHQRLVETSRLAGMAEVATDVLHNVGNVLNSVNISCSLTLEKVRSFKMPSLSRVSSLLWENRERLPEFFSRNPKARQIPEFLAAATAHLSDEQAVLQKELEQLVKHIDHIKQIVAMQQNYAKVAGVLENVTPRSLVDDALHINAAALVRHDVQVRCDFEEIPAILTERHKVLQILVNLIRNAKYAMDDAGRSDKLLTIRLRNDPNQNVKIEVIDNGVGIPKENLTRIFFHGFTTRRNGHGFGLHSSALAVRELGGTLEAQSDGPGTGARFTLMLPHTPPQRTEKLYESANA